MQDDMVGQFLGQYELMELIGKGGIARVYKSIQPALERYVAVKLLHPSVAADDEFLARFRREAKATASLRHPHIVQIFDFGHQEEVYYIVMELIDGPTLRDELQRLRALDKTLPFSEVQRIVGEVSEALGYAHDRGIIHRDVKPANILLTPEGQAVLSDFSLAFMIEGLRQTITGFVGTPEYMSPEQCQGLAVDGRSDVYSLGVVLYEMLTGQVPFTSKTPMGTVMKHISEPLPPPRSVNPNIPKPMERVVLRALAKAPEDRYQRVREMAEALEQAVEEAETGENRRQQETAGLTGKTIGKYRIRERLGRGGMAEVYKAYQPGLDRYVAIKVLHSFLAEEEDFIGRFEREAAAVAKLRHSNIVQVIDFDHEGDLYYIVMEFIDGPTLKAELKERSLVGQPFDPKEATRILTAIGNAVDYAHRRGMVHRDLKPGNIMFTSEGQPVLTDFGIARIVGAKRYTVTGAVSGTPAYMAPEQGQGERGDERSDIYSLGVILYEMVTGRVPFDAETPYAIIMKHIKDPLPLPRQVYPQLSESVERVILKTLSKNPADRYQTAGEMARALQQALGATEIPTVPAQTAARPSDTLTVSPSRVRIPIVPAEPAVRPQPEYVEAEQIVGPPVAFPSVALLVVKGENIGSEYLLETDSAVIGRASECDVAIGDEAASRQHARLSREGDHFVLSDLESANGTFVNEQRISDLWELRDGDRIRIGETVLEFQELISPAELSWQGKPDRLVALRNDWQGAVKSLHDDGAFRSHAAAILANIGDSLGFRMQSRGEKRRQLVSFLINAPTLGRLKISRFPAVFLQRQLVTRRDVEDLRDLIDDLGASNRFGLFVALQDPQKTRSLFDETLRPMCDFVVLGEEDVARIVRMRDHRRALMESILNQVMDLTVVSPFVTAGPVPENMFFGRENEIRTIVQTIQNNSRAVVGGRRIGKTSTLHKVERLLSRSGNGYRILYMNCQDVSNYEDFFRSINVDWQPSVLITDFSPVSFKEFIIRLKIGGEGPIVVILDETDRILRYDMDNDEKLFKVFRGLSEEGHCQFLLSGERILSMQMRDSRSPLFNFCEIMPLRYLERKDAEQLITEPMALMGIELQRPSELIEQILDVSSCHPRMVQYICHQLIQRISQESSRIVRLDDLHKATTSSAFYSDYIETIWAQTLPLERLITLIMIQRQDQADSEMSAPDQTAMIVEGLTSTEIQQTLGDLGIELKTRQVKLALDNLELYAIVERRAKRYRFIPQAFPRFLKEVKDIPETIELLIEQIEDEGIA